MDEVILNTFPATEIDALAMFYVQNVVFPSLPEVERTPEVLMRAYREACEAFRQARRDIRAESQGKNRQ